MKSNNDKYKVKFTISGSNDVRKIKKYILDTFKYRELGENFTKKIKNVMEDLKILPTGFDTIGVQYRGYDIYMMPYRTYLFFYVVDNETKTVTVLRVMQDGMDWQFILKRWLQEHN